MFLETDWLRNDEIWLKVEKQFAGENGEIPYYGFAIMSHSGVKMGACSFRLGSDEVVGLFGHIGYRVMEEYRGRGLAAKACGLVKELARRHGYDHLIVTCNPDNIPSCRTCERAGGKLVRVIDVPKGSELYARGDRTKNIYRIDL